MRFDEMGFKDSKLLKLIPFSVPLTAAVGGLYWLIGRMM